jgi:Lon protease-like protein
MSEPRALAMFPLGTVLFPSAVLPLHVFEPRYRAMVHHLLDGGVEPELGVVLIERGSEVGGGDVRVDVGTLARIARAEELADGRWALVTFGVSRLRVVEWLPSDDERPWPRALVADLVDVGLDDAHVDEWPALQAEVRATLAMAAELGDPVPAATVPLADDPGLGSLQAAAVAGIPVLDQQLVLGTDSVPERLALVTRLVAERRELLEARLRLGP